MTAPYENATSGARDFPCPRCQGTGRICMTIGERLVALRQDRGIIQADVEKATGLSHATLWRMEKASNSNGGSVDTLIALADFYRISLDDLVGRLLPAPAAKEGANG